ncbi:unnamed protein product [Urochloa decumbens]|uniref:DUF1618 domain-containing protein n=1 Tax=Urochloa decumbens TaxID=240449 RepID=A0ABC9B950_9POAL
MNNLASSRTRQPGGGTHEQLNTDGMQAPSGSPAATAAAAPALYPPWVLLENRCIVEDEGTNSTADAKTVAACRTSTGDPIRVSVRAAAPPAASSICVEVASSSNARIIAAHGDSVLFTVSFDGYKYGHHPDYFVYSAGAAAAAVPPSLSLLPPCYHAEKKNAAGYYCTYSQSGPVQRYLNADATGLLRRGEYGLVLASLMDINGSDHAKVVERDAAELLLFRDGEWRITRAAISSGEGNKDQELRLSSWETDRVVSVGDNGILCFVQFGHGLMFSNVFDKTPVLRHVRFPPSEDVDLPQTCRGSSQDVCATSDGTVKFVDVQPRCCCGSPGATHCRHSSNAYTIKTWTLKMDDMAWVMDGMVDATELWALDAYKALPRVQLVNPIVSLDEPHVICFMVCERFYVKEHGDRTEWLILVDMKSKTLRSVCRYDQGRGFFRGRIFHPSRLSDYFNSTQSFSDGASSSVGKRSMATEPPPSVIANQQLTDNTSNSKVASPEEMILAALQEIPGLAREEMLRAYSILIHDQNGRRLRALMALPMTQDWLLMEIKAGNI